MSIILPYTFHYIDWLNRYQILKYHRTVSWEFEYCWVGICLVGSRQVNSEVVISNIASPAGNYLDSVNRENLELYYATYQVIKYDSQHG